ncbi:MAG: hypothetical protein HKN23_01610 [Verrucomicrobiales bacterium]|nr:hypothetical protein [Verrucomicrobiales bacterium]
MKRTIFPVLLAAISATQVATAADGFEWKDTEGKHVDLLFNGRPVARYQYERINDERREETYKPFHHVYDWEGEDFITKGPGGQYTHHRGIYYGFSKCSYKTEDGKEFKGQDTWHCSKAHQTHEKFIQQTADEQRAEQTVEIDWHGNDGTVFTKEKRTLIFSFQGDDLVVDFHSVLVPTQPEVRVDGDPQHAGFQFRASNEVSASTKKETYYIRPKSGKAEKGKTINWSAKTDNETTRDLPFKGMSVVVGGERYSIAYLDSPGNPKPARYSERDYGRFGSYFATDVSKDKPLVVKYRLVMRKGEFELSELEKLSADFVAHQK